MGKYPMSIFVVSLVLVLVLLGVGIYLFKMSSRKKTKTIEGDPIGDETIYSQSEHNNKTNKKLTLKEKMDLSWNFLYEITEIIMNKFSAEDRGMLSQIGISLLNNGMRYEHVVELGIKPTRSKTQAIDQERQQETTSQRTV